jgi:hypothetical protein
MSRMRLWNLRSCRKRLSWRTWKTFLPLLCKRRLPRRSAVEIRHVHFNLLISVCGRSVDLSRHRIWWRRAVVVIDSTQAMRSGVGLVAYLWFIVLL